MATMDREGFAEYLDDSWLDFRQRLLAVYPEASVASNSASKGSSGSHDHVKAGILGNSSSLDDPMCSTSIGVRSLVSTQENKFHISAGTGLSDDLNEDEEHERGSEQDPENNELLAGAMAHRTKEQVEAVRNRLRLRLGATSSNKLVSGRRLLEAVQSLGLTKYTEEDMNGFVNQLAGWINLTFEGVGTRVPRAVRNQGGEALYQTASISGCSRFRTSTPRGRKILGNPSGATLRTSPSPRTDAVALGANPPVLQCTTFARRDVTTTWSQHNHW